MFFHVRVVFYTQSLVLMLQYHILTIKHSTVPLFIRYVLLCVCCILHIITCTKVTISHINNQTFYHSFVYTVCSFMCSLYFTHNHWYSCYKIRYQQSNILPFPCLYGMFFHVRVVFYTQSLVLMLQYHISTTKHLSVPVFILYVLLCACCILHTIISTNVTISHINNQTFYCSLVYTVCSFMCFCIVHTITCTNVTISHINNQTFYCSLVYTVCSFMCFCILHTITCTNATISHINNQTFISSRVYTVCYFICLFYFTHNHLYQCYNIT